jgi:formiminotetrahydrofolate cyclodeaminase
VSLNNVTCINMAELENAKRLPLLSLQEIWRLTDQEFPQVTGGCVLLTSATLSMAMVLMALRISRKKVGEGGLKREITRQIRRISSTQRNLSDAGIADQECFNAYRRVLKSKSKTKKLHLISSLKNANSSLKSAAAVLKKAFEEAKSSLDVSHETVACDVEAALLVLDGTLRGVQVLSDSNSRMIEHMEAEI